MDVFFNTDDVFSDFYSVSIPYFPFSLNECHIFCILAFYPGRFAQGSFCNANHLFTAVSAYVEIYFLIKCFMVSIISSD